MRQVLVALTVVWSVVVGGTAKADEPAKDARSTKPPWQRYLQGEDAKRAAEQDKQLARLQEAGQFAEALKVAEALAALRAKAQGADHWEAIDARAQVEAIHRVLRQVKEVQMAYAGSLAVARQGETLFQKGSYREAQPFLEKVLAINRKVLGEEHAYTADSYYNLAIALRYRGMHAEAEEGLRKALAIRRKVLGEEHPDTARCYRGVAETQHERGKYAEAEEGLRKALAICRKVMGEEHPVMAATYNGLGRSLNAQAKYAEAEEIYRRALAIARKVHGEQHPGTAAVYNNLAQNQQDQGKYREAEELFRKDLAISRKVLGEEHPETATSYNSLATNLSFQGKYTEAEEGLHKALAIRRKVLGEEHLDTATSYNDLAHILDVQGRHDEAEESQRKALAIYCKVLGEEHPYTARIFANLAYILDDQGKYPEAELYYRKVLAICRKVLGEEHPDTATSYTCLAYNLNVQGKHDEAQEGLRKALAIYRKVVGEEHPDTATCYKDMARSLDDQGKYREAELYYRKVLAIRRKVRGEEHPDTAKGYYYLAHNQYCQGKYREAEKFWRLDAESFVKTRLLIAASGLERASITSKESPLPWLAAVLVRNGKPEDAWQRFEESLARGTWDDLSARLRRPPAEQAKQGELDNRLRRIDQLIEKTFSAKAETAEQKKRRDDLLTQRRQLQDELDALAHRLETTYGPAAGQVFDRQHIQASLPVDTALVGWLDLRGYAKAADPDGEHWAVLLRSSGDPIWVRLRGSGDKDAWTDGDTKRPVELRTALQSSQGDWRPLAQRLRRQRLDPLAKHLDGVRHLVVLPSTALAGVPAEVIADGYTVSYALSGTLYAHLHNQPKQTSKGLLALADPVFERPVVAERPLLRGGEDNWGSLPGTRIEVEALRRLFGDKLAPTLLTDSQASEQQMDALAKSGDLGKYRYLHLATHGTVDDRAPLRSAVILSRDALPDPGKQLNAGLPIFDGRLTAREVLERWHLNSDLVTLSACQTALGKYERGEGFIGFAQALILAGSRSVCLSLWKVDDAATALLMERFYQNLLGKREGLKAPLGKAQALAEAKAWLRGLSRAEALRRAARLSEGVARGKGRKMQPLLPAVAKEGADDDRPYAHPYYWAAFVLIGEPD